jgi:hypothetical protein
MQRVIALVRRPPPRMKEVLLDRRALLVWNHE